MVLNILGVLISFAFVMLLLSLIVTALTQLIQGSLKLRLRNLEEGLRSFLASQNALKKLEGKEDKDPVKAILDTTYFAPEKENMFSRYLKASRSWIDVDDLWAILKDRSVKVANKAKFEKAFKRMEDYTRKRFLQRVRVITVICSFVVAFFFQVNAIQLLRDLSTDPALRARYTGMAENLKAEAEAAMKSLFKWENISNEALEELKKQHPEIAPQIEEASGLGTDEDAIIGELRTILQSDSIPESDKIIKQYEEILEKRYNVSTQEAYRQYKDLTNKLAMFNIQLWQYELEFYKSTDNCLGVLLTVILLTLGAPFWYNVLCTLVNLKDQLQPESEKKEKDKDKIIKIKIDNK